MILRAALVATLVVVMVVTGCSRDTLPPAPAPGPSTEQSVIEVPADDAAVQAATQWATQYLADTLPEVSVGEVRKAWRGPGEAWSVCDFGAGADSLLVVLFAADLGAYFDEADTYILATDGQRVVEGYSLYVPEAFVTPTAWCDVGATVPAT